MQSITVIDQTTNSQISTNSDNKNISHTIIHRYTKQVHYIPSLFPKQKPRSQHLQTLNSGAFTSFYITVLLCVLFLNLNISFHHDTPLYNQPVHGTASYQTPAAICQDYSVQAVTLSKY